MRPLINNRRSAYIAIKRIEEYPNYWLTETGHVISGKTNKSLAVRESEVGYLCCNLYKNGKPTTKKVHQLMGRVFLGKVENDGLEVNHIDGDKTNNSLSNLELVTKSANMKHAVKLGLVTPPTRW